MLLFIKIISITSIHTLLGVIMPGLSIYTMLNKQWKHKDSPIDTVLKILTIGIQYNFYQFLLGFIIIATTTLSNEVIVFLKYFADFLIISIMLLNKNHLQVMKKTSDTLILYFKNNLHEAFIFLLALIFGVLAILNYPKIIGADPCSALYILINNGTASYSQAYSHSLGAFGFISILYFPAVLFKTIPIITMASGFKVLLSLLYGLVILYIVKLLPLSKFKLVYSSLFVFIATSAIGFFGIIKSGKASFFSFAFLLLFIFSLIDNYNTKVLSIDRTKSLHLSSTLFLSCALVFSAISLPYIVLFLLLFFVFNKNNLKINQQLTKYFICLGIIPFLVLFFSMVTAYHLIILVSLLFLVWIFFAVAMPLKHKLSPNINKTTAAIVYVVLLIIGISLCNLLMPINFDSVKHYSLIPNTSTFGQLLGGYSGLPVPIIFLGLLGIFLIAFGEKYKNITALRIIAMAPLLMLLGTVVTIKYFDFSQAVNYSKVYLLDIVKGTARLFSPVYFGIFSLIFIDIFSSLFSKKHKQTIFNFFVLVLLSFSIAKNSDLLMDLKNFAYFTSVGGDKNICIANFQETLYRLSRKTTLERTMAFNAKSSILYKPSKKILYDNSHEMMFYEYMYFVPPHFASRAILIDEDRVINNKEVKKYKIPDIFFNKPLLLITNNEHIKFLQEKYKKSSFTEIERIPFCNEGLYINSISKFYYMVKSI